MGSLRILSVLTALISVLSYSQGLQCYNCLYTPSIDPGLLPPEFADFFGESCKNGNTPEDKFAVTCSEVIPEGDTTCAKVFVRGEYMNFPLEVTMRSCVSADAGIADGFQKVTVEDVANIPGLDPELVELIKDFSEDTAVELCSCNADKCLNEGEDGGDDGGDGGDGGGDGGSSGNTLQITSLVWVLSSVMLVMSNIL